ncbi:hypothetical protein [Clostridium estertheticum]|uniref:hypothetical protein n=1 Tax=Clostridium estertheticum TaxID=238834 RepID=UPI001C0B6661|nr:hypothetical protein [Clostridium estertheticum]MBU3072649.1 hypothetical protein [Clostridium estertheticum]MBU3162742.1 hypothetical protein [Clostridium estertheticum]MBX4260838.1 hypothetical protein [Clostridium estertheticum]MCB2340160.1 hypothetical protein [Clostridium estertheticum]MCB2361372.1 hypothetical protein [Clostridium estertheticum]
MSLFEDIGNNVVEDIEFVEITDEDRNIIRKARFIILDTAIIYNEEEDFYYTLATCINENKEIETISIESFGIQENVLEFKGAYIDYEEYEQNSKINYTGRIYYL